MSDEACWQIYKSDGLGDLIPAATVGTLSAAARRIIDMEAISVESLTFQLHVDANFYPDVDVLDHLECKGQARLLRHQARAEVTGK